MIESARVCDPIQVEHLFLHKKLLVPEDTYKYKGRVESRKKKEIRSKAERKRSAN